jgi:hypothetical protein
MRPRFALADVFASNSPKIFVAILNDPVVREPGLGSLMTISEVTPHWLRTATKDQCDLDRRRKWGPGQNVLDKSSQG